jgi:hypothetical protein
VLIAGAVLAAGALTASLAFASPTTYELVPDPSFPSVISGTFTLDPDEQEPYRDWKFILELAPDFTLVSTSLVEINSLECCPERFEFGGAQSGVDPWQLFVHVNFESNVGGSYEIQIVRIDHVTFNVLNNFDEFGTLRMKDASVPEPAWPLQGRAGCHAEVHGSSWGKPPIAYYHHIASSQTAVPAMGPPLMVDRDWPVAPGQMTARQARHEVRSSGFEVPTTFSLNPFSLSTCHASPPFPPISLASIRHLVVI